MDDKNLLEKSNLLYEALKKNNITIALAESCTGGMIASALVAIPGISDYFVEGFVTYSNEAKQKRLGVKESTLSRYGAVSEETVREMLAGLESDSGIAVSGIAGPGGGSTEKPVGTVYIGVFVKESIIIERFLFSGGRQEVRKQAAEKGIELLSKLVADINFP